MRLAALAHRSIAAAAVVLALPTGGAAQTLAVAQPTGQVIGRLRSAADTTQTYALYLPAAYTSERRWPVVLIMDPRGRALIPLERFRPAAERLGYVLVSSYDTRSDGPPDPNYRALNAMLDDVQRFLSIDGRRFYLAGFSGTARIAWGVSEQFKGALAGIIGVGAGLPGTTLWLDATIQGAPFVFFGAIGTEDFNHVEMRLLDQTLAARAFPHHLEEFAGPHGWSTEPASSLALEWMELQAMRRKLTPTRHPWLDSLASARLAAARALDSARAGYGAWQRYEAIVRDFDGLADSATIGVARRRAAELGRDREVRRAGTRLLELDDRERRYAITVDSVMRDLRGTRLPALRDVTSRLQVDAIAKQAASDDTLLVHSARRMLALASVMTSFYAPQELAAAHRDDAAALARAIAAAIDTAVNRRR
jgi:dienelactone hydrolase